MVSSLVSRQEVPSSVASVDGSVGVQDGGRGVGSMDDLMDEGTEDTRGEMVVDTNGLWGGVDWGGCITDG